MRVREQVERLASREIALSLLKRRVVIWMERRRERVYVWACEREIEGYLPGVVARRGGGR